MDTDRLRGPSNEKGSRWKLIVGGVLIWTLLVVLVTSQVNPRKLNDPNLSRQAFLASKSEPEDVMSRMDIFESAMEMGEKPSAAVMKVMSEVVPEGDSRYGWTRHWFHIPGKLIHVSMCRNGVIWGVNRNHDIFQNRYWHGRMWGWRHVPGKLMMISVGGDNSRHVIGVNKHHYIYERDGISRGATHGTRWIRIPGRLKDISTDNIRTFGVNKYDHIWERTEDTTWRHVGGRLMQISVGGAHTVGVNRHHNIYNRWHGHWQHIPGKAIVASRAADGEFWVVNRNHDIFRYCGGRHPWQHIGGKLKQIHVASRRQIIGVNKYDNIYARR